MLVPVWFFSPLAFFGVGVEFDWDLRTVQCWEMLGRVEGLKCIDRWFCSVVGQASWEVHEVG